MNWRARLAAFKLAAEQPPLAARLAIGLAGLLAVIGWTALFMVAPR